MATMTTWRARFERGDYPLVCARSGRPADKFVPVEAARRAAWPFVLFPVSALAWLFAWASVDRDRIWGRLPFAAGQVTGISATWDRHADVVTLKGVHPASSPPATPTSSPLPDQALPGPAPADHGARLDGQMTPLAAPCRREPWWVPASSRHAERRP